MRARLQLQPVEHEKAGHPRESGPQWPGATGYRPLPRVTRLRSLRASLVAPRLSGARFPIHATSSGHTSIRPATLRLATQYIATMQSEAIH